MTGSASLTYGESVTLASLRIRMKTKNEISKYSKEATRLKNIAVQQDSI